MPQSQSEKSEKKKESASSGKKSKIVEDPKDTAEAESKQVDTPSKIPATQATITQLFRDGQDADKSSKSSKTTTASEAQRVREERSVESLLRSLESKMDKMVTVEYLQKEFKKLITEEFLSSKIEQLKRSVKEYFDNELEKVYSKVQALEKRAATAEDNVEKLESRIRILEHGLETVQNKTKKLENEQKEHISEIGQVKFALKSREIQMNDLEQYTRSNNIRIYGLDDRNKEEMAEETTRVVLNFLSNKLDIDLRDSDIDIAHRLGKFLKEGNRPVICRFASRLNKMRVMKNRRLLKGSEVENVKTAWSDQGKIIALLEAEEGEGSPKVVVTLKTDLSLPLTTDKTAFKGRFKRK